MASRRVPALNSLGDLEQPGGVALPSSCDGLAAGVPLADMAAGGRPLPRAVGRPYYRYGSGSRLNTQASVSSNPGRRPSATPAADPDDWPGKGAPIIDEPTPNA
jgi:hypothetical protein